MHSTLDNSFLLPLGFSFILYLTSLAFYRLVLHPLARFPGPKLAALTRYYETYYDVVHNGKYTFKIAELHEQYGMETSLSHSYLPAHSSIKVQS